MAKLCLACMFVRANICSSGGALITQGLPRPPHPAHMCAEDFSRHDQGALEDGSWIAQISTLFYVGHRKQSTFAVGLHFN